jgi:hypothetical protein
LVLVASRKGGRPDLEEARSVKGASCWTEKQR